MGGGPVGLKASERAGLYSEGDGKCELRNAKVGLKVLKTPRLPLRLHLGARGGARRPVKRGDFS